MAHADAMVKRQAIVDGNRPPDQGDIDTLMRRFFEQGRTEAGEVAAPVEPVRPRRDFDMACELLDRASQAFDLLVGRCQRLEGELGESEERARAQASEQDATIDQWKRLASGLKAQVDASEQAAADVKARLDAAETRAAAALARVTALERASAQAAGHAALAESLSTKLHDKVVSAFGIGSRAHPVLEAVATRVAAD